MPRTIVHIITDLNQGGAEAVLLTLMTNADGEYDTHVISLIGPGYYSPQFEKLPLTLHYLSFSSAGSALSSLVKLYKLLKALNPAIVQTWLYHADVIGGLTAKLATKAKVIWNIRNGNIDRKLLSSRTWLLVKFSAMISGSVPHKIISCSKKAVTTHANTGYRANKFVVIPNGINTDRYYIDHDVKKQVRQSLNIADDVLIVGNISRWHPLKDHMTLLQAFAALYKKYNNCYLLLAGKKLEHTNVELTNAIKDLGLTDHVILVGPQAQVERMMNCLDIHVLSSVGEAFPNVVAESMACGVPNVVTDVGDAAEIVGDLGIVVPIKDKDALALAIEQQLDAIKQNRELSTQVSDRVKENFSLDRMVKNYNEFWRSLA